MDERSPMTTYTKKHSAILQSIAHRAMLEQGLLPDISNEVLLELKNPQSPTRDAPDVRDMRRFVWASIDNDDSIEDFMIAANGISASTLSANGCTSIRPVVRTPKRRDRIVAIAKSHQYELPYEPDSKKPWRNFSSMPRQRTRCASLTCPWL